MIHVHHHSSKAIKSCKRKTTESKLERLRRNNNYGAYSANGGNGLPRQVAPGKVQLYNEIQEAERKILYEIAIMKKLRHGQIVRLYEIIDDKLNANIYISARIFMLNCLFIYSAS